MTDKKVRRLDAHERLGGYCVTGDQVFNFQPSENTHGSRFESEKIFSEGSEKCIGRAGYNTGGTIMTKMPA